MTEHRTINLKRLRMIANDLSEDGHYGRAQTVNDAADVIEALLEASHEGLNQLAIASSYVKFYGNTKGDGQSHSAWECNESGKDIIIDAINRVDD